MSPFRRAARVGAARGAALVLGLVRFGHRHPRATVAGAAVVVAAGIGFGAHLKFETDIMSLVPRHDPVVETFTKTIEQFGSLDTLLVAVPVRDGDVDLSLALVDALGPRLAESPLLASVQWRLQDPLELAEAVLPHAVQFLDEDGLEELRRRLEPAGIEARAADIRASLETPLGMMTKGLLVRDPLGFLPLLLGRVAHTPSTLRVDYTSGYYLSADHSLVLLLATPTGPAQEISFDEALFKDLRKRVAEARRSLAEDEEIPVQELPHVMLGGGHRIALEDATLIRGDIIANSATSVAGVMLLFFLAYRRLAAAQYAFVPLAVGLALTFVFTALALGRLNSATSAFSALLVGLGIDFTIVLYGRYLEGRHRGLSLSRALEAMALRSGPAVLLGAITTVGTFYSFLVTRFAGLRELGLLTGTGIVLMALSAFVLLPALVTLFDRGRKPPELSRLIHVEPVLTWSARHRRAVLAVVAVVTVAALAVLPRVRFDDDVRNLRSPSNRGVAIQRQVAEAFGLSFNAMMVRVEADTVEHALDRVQRLAAGLMPLVRSGVVSSFESLATLFPPRGAQQRADAWIHEHQTLTDPERVTVALRRAMADQGLVPDAFAEGFDLLARALRPSGDVTPAVWDGTPVEELVARSLARGPDGVTTVVNVFPPPGRWRRTAPPELENLVATVPGATLTGVNVVSERLRHTVWRDAGMAGAVGLVVVFLMLLWELKGVRDALVALVPVGLGVVWTVGLMAALGFALNFLNVFVVTMVIGVGVDYGIHMLHRLREDARPAAVGETARAVVFAALTTIVGFGSLVTTHYPGLQSIGWMTSLGVLFSCVAAVVVLPLLSRERRSR